MLNQKIIEKEFALFGSEQNPDPTEKGARSAREAGHPGRAGPVEAFKAEGADFVVAETSHELLAGMQRRSPELRLELARIEREISARDRDRELDNDFTKDAWITLIRQARHHRGDRLIRTSSPHKLLDPKNGPLIAVKLRILTRKSLGDIETDLFARVVGPNRQPVPGLYAAGEANGFGGAAVTAIARSRERSSTAACSQVAPRAARSPPRCRSATRARSDSWRTFGQPGRVLPYAPCPKLRRDDLGPSRRERAPANGRRAG